MQKSYTIIMEKTEDGKSQVTRTNDGFNVFELLGLLSLTQSELVAQLKGEIKPDIIKRNVIE